MPKNNDEVAAALNEIADLMQIGGRDRFRVLAYRRAADEISAMGKDILSIDAADLAKVRGIGKAIAQKIEEFAATGSMAKLEQMRSEVPSGLRQMTSLPGVGPRTAALLHAQLGISSIAELERAVSQQAVRQIRGLGAKTEESIGRSLKAFAKKGARVHLDHALALAGLLVEQIRVSGTTEQVTYAGSLRRRKETIGDIDVLASAGDPHAVMDVLAHLDGVDSVSAAGSTKSSIVSDTGQIIDLRVVAPDEFGAALQYFTGSKEHNVRVRELAVKQGLKLSEYGLFRISDNVRVASATEDEIYAYLGMATPPATIRENRGEIEAALAGDLPTLVSLSDLKGDFHSHSTYSDGAATLEEMVEAAIGLGHEYYAISDHGRNTSVHCMDEQDVLRQRAHLDQIRASLPEGFVLMQGVELNIARDGGLDYPPAFLAGFDVVIASMHYELNSDATTNTRRLIAAIEDPEVNVIGHPTSRRIGSRLPAEFDLEEVFKAAAQNRVALEVNSNPKRLDLKDDHIRMAVEMGCYLSINSDSHDPHQLTRIDLGVFTAQRGWATADRIVNTWPIDKVRRFFDRSQPWFD